MKDKGQHNKNNKQVTDSDDDEMPLANILKSEKCGNRRKSRKIMKKSKSNLKHERAIAIKKECINRDPLGLSDGESHMNVDLDIILNPFNIKQEDAFDVSEIKHDYEYDEDFQFFLTLVPLMDQLSPNRKSKIRKDLINVVIKQCNDAIEKNEYYDSAHLRWHQMEVTAQCSWYNECKMMPVQLNFSGWLGQLYNLVEQLPGKLCLAIQEGLAKNSPVR